MEHMWKGQQFVMSENIKPSKDKDGRTFHLLQNTNMHCISLDYVTRMANCNVFFCCTVKSIGTMKDESNAIQ